MLKNVFRLSLIGLRVIRERDWLSFILENWTKLYLPTIRDLKLNQLISSLMRVFRELEMKRSNQTWFLVFQVVLEVSMEEKYPPMSIRISSLRWSESSRPIPKLVSISRTQISSNHFRFWDLILPSSSNSVPRTRDYRRLSKSWSEETLTQIFSLELMIKMKYHNKRKSLRVSQPKRRKNLSNQRNPNQNWMRLTRRRSKETISTRKKISRRLSNATNRLSTWNPLNFSTTITRPPATSRWDNSTRPSRSASWPSKSRRNTPSTTSKSWPNFMPD